MGAPSAIGDIIRARSNQVRTDARIGCEIRVMLGLPDTGSESDGLCEAENGDEDGMDAHDGD